LRGIWLGCFDRSHLVVKSFVAGSDSDDRWARDFMAEWRKQTDDGILLRLNESDASLSLLPIGNSRANWQDARADETQYPFTPISAHYLGIK
jgi:hypothetical protein